MSREGSLYRAAGMASLSETMISEQRSERDERMNHANIQGRGFCAEGTVCLKAQRWKCASNIWTESEGAQGRYATWERGKELEMKVEKDWVPGGQPCRPQ